MIRVLLLGGTTEASQMARTLAVAGVDAVFSYAGRTAAPIAQPLPLRVGGFGEVAGLANYLVQEKISHVIDATHPFAAQMSRHAVDASALAHVPIIALERAPWQAEPGDNWQSVADVASAAAALPVAPARVFLAIGKQLLPAFAERPQHHYLLRLIDPPTHGLPMPDAVAVIARGPFTFEDDLALIKAHRITHIVAKNAGGMGARAKLDAARALNLPVILIDRPALPERHIARTVADVMKWLDHLALRGV